MAHILAMLNLNKLTCNETCVGPGSDTVSVHALLQDITNRAAPVDITGTDVTIGPFDMDMKKNLKAGSAAKAEIGPLNIFRNITYGRAPNPPGALPDNLQLSVSLIKAMPSSTSTYRYRSTFTARKPASASLSAR
jgi:hypothetical protein